MSLFFYDLETSGINPRIDRIMQFAGQETDMKLKPIGEPVNILIKMPEDVLPEPAACLVTGITPQKTIAEGITEAEFARVFDKKISKPNTVFVGFNNVRFDDEFMRFLLYRNFYDPYEWQWKDGRSRWDLLDMTRMARALRPDGINWPVDSEGRPTNRLEMLSSANKLDHANAHDALSDVRATIAIAKLVRQASPKLFDYLLDMRDKKKIARLCESGQLLVYTSGKYDNKFAKTTIVAPLGRHPDRQGILVYDLRQNPEKYINLPPEKLADIWKYDKDKKKIELPVKALQFNRCPSVAPIGVLDGSSKKRLSIDMKQIKANKQLIYGSKDFYNRLVKALEILNKERQTQPAMVQDAADAEQRLYDEFIPGRDKRLLTQITSASPNNILAFTDKLGDKRLQAMLLPYKARNYIKSLSDSELRQWEAFRKTKLLAGGSKSRFAVYGKKLEELSKNAKTDKQKYLLDELKLYGLGIRPED